MDGTRLRLGVGVIIVWLLTGCAPAEPPLSIGEAVPLESDVLEVSLTVTAVTTSDFESLGLTGLFTDVPPDGVPWLVDYRLDLASGVRADFSWDAVPSLTASAWTATSTSGEQVEAAKVQGAGIQDWCPGYQTDLPDDVVGTYCHVFILPDGQELDEVSIADVATWTINPE
ncbi:MAG: hypothetical protein ACK5H2_08145 [Beutenbergiaceae bacterium]